MRVTVHAYSAITYLFIAMCIYADMNTCTHILYAIHAQILYIYCLFMRTTIMSKLLEKCLLTQNNETCYNINDMKDAELAEHIEY